MNENKEPIFKIENLFVEIPTRNGIVHAVNGITLSIEKGRTLGLVGESGCGKTISCLAALGLLEEKFQVKGKIYFDCQEIGMLPLPEKRKYRGKHIGLIMQNPMTAFNPLLTVAEHFTETILSHTTASRSEIYEKASTLLQKVGIAACDSILHQYPIQLSGGMLQRVMIALALALEPPFLIADEPTTALDTTLQTQVLRLLKELQKKNNVAMLCVSHDVGMVSRNAERVAVMYAGYIVELGPTEKVFRRPLHPYTRGLLLSRPRFTRERLQTMPGHPPSLLNLPEGCPFYSRCPKGGPLCLSYTMDLCSSGDDRHVSCAYLERTLDRQEEQDYGSVENTVNCKIL